jgi:hypothetical protein
MTVRSKISGRHLIRLTIVGLFCIGFGLYCLYDGMVAWPKQRERALAFQELKDEGREGEWPLIAAEHGWKPYDQGEPARVFQELKEQNREDEWLRVVEEHGWKAFDPGKPRTEAEIAVQYYMLAICGAAGLLILSKVLWSIGRWVEMDDAGLRSSRGQEVKFDEIDKIDKKKWENKGIAKVLYQDNGRVKVFTLDDFIYDRPTTDDILREVESRVGVDKIINGKPEPPPQPAPAPAGPAQS